MPDFGFIFKASTLSFIERTRNGWRI